MTGNPDVKYCKIVTNRIRTVSFRLKVPTLDVWRLKCGKPFLSHRM